MRRDWKESIAQLYGTLDGMYCIMELFHNGLQSFANLYGYLRSTIFASKNVKLSYFYDGTEIENICFRPERKSFCDSQSSEVFIIYCLTRKHKLLVLSYST